MAVKHYVWAQNTDNPALLPMQRYVYLELAFWSDSKGVVRMAQSEVSEKTHLSLRTTKTTFKALMTQGYITMIGHGRYLLNLGEQVQVPVVDNRLDDLSAFVKASGAKQGDWLSVKDAELDLPSIKAAITAGALIPMDERSGPDAWLYSWNLKPLS